MGRKSCMKAVYNWPNKMLVKYNTVLMNHPVRVMLVVLGLSVSCTVYTVRVGSLPDFSEPTLGFTTRGTDIANSIEAWNHLADLNSTYIQDPSNALQNGSIDYLKYGTHNMVHARSGKGRLFLLEKNAHLYTREDWEDDVTEEYDDVDDVEIEQADQPMKPSGVSEALTANEDYGHVVYGIDDMASELNRTLATDNMWQKLRLNHVPFRDYFCDLSTSTNKAVDNVRLVMKRMNNHKHADETLFELKALRAMCDLQTRIESAPSFHKSCVKDANTPHCCMTWSLPNFVVLINRLQHCYDVQFTHVQHAQLLMKMCLPYYRDGQLQADCQLYECDAPPQCTANNVVYQMMHYLSNNASLTATTWQVSSAMFLMPLARTAPLLPLYNELHDIDLKNKYVEVVAMDFGDMKDDLFDVLVYPRGVYIVYVLAGFCIIFTLIWLNTRSFLYTVCSVFTILIVLALSVFIYSYVIPRDVFPFMNLLAIIAYSVYGTVDVVVFSRVWNLTLKSHGLPKTLQKIAESTMRTSISGFLTTTILGSMFVVMIMSPIRDIRLFGYFAFIMLICHYIIMLTWVPASHHITWCTCCFADNWRKPFSTFATKWDQCTSRIITRYLNKAACITSCIIVVVASIMLIVFNYFNSQWFPLSESPRYQLFANNHPIERYDNQYRNQFTFETDADKENAPGTMPLYFVWGLIPNGQSILVDKTLDAYATESQSWLRSFCQDVQQQSFSKRMPTGGPRTANCFIETVAISMRRECVNEVRNYDRSPCCNISTFPIEPALYKTCLPRIIGSLYRTPSSYFRRSSAGPLFEKFKFNHSYIGRNARKPEPKMRAFVLRFESTVDYTSPYSVVQKMEQDVRIWFDNELSRAPTSLRHGWFVSDLMLFDVQHNITYNLYTSCIVALSVAVLVLLFTTKHILLTSGVIITAVLSGLTILCILVEFFDWKLYVLESICLNVSIALITQCSLLYALAFCDSIPECFGISSRHRTIFACKHMIGPAMFAVSVSAVLAGLLAQSPIHPISRLGTVMAITVSVSVIFGTFFFICGLYLTGLKIVFPIGCLWTWRRRPQQLNGNMNLESPGNEGANEELNAAVLNVDAESGRRTGGHDIEMKRTVKGSVRQNPLYNPDMDETSFGPASTVPTMQVHPVADALVEVHKSPTTSEDESSISLSAAGRQPLLPSNPNVIEAENSSDGAPDTQSSSLGVATNASIEAHLGSPMSTGAISDLPSDEIAQPNRDIEEDDDTGDDIISTSD